MSKGFVSFLSGVPGCRLINVSVQHNNSGFLLVFFVLLVHPINVTINTIGEVLYLQPMILPECFDILPLN